MRKVAGTARKFKWHTGKSTQELRADDIAKEFDVNIRPTTIYRGMGRRDVRNWKGRRSTQYKI